MFLLYKAVDKSLLYDGFSIPIAHKDKLLIDIGLDLKHGDKATISVILDGITYTATLLNLAFNQQKYPTHKDIIQVRYGRNSPLAKTLRNHFVYSINLFEENSTKYNSKWLSALREDQKEHVAVYTTEYKNSLLLDCITSNEFDEECSEILTYEETIAEHVLNRTDTKAGIYLKTKANKVRRLNKSIGDDLKKLYGFRCQICGRFIGKEYGSCLIHAHHIEYFTKSMNNNMDNIMIVCPNHHSIIHDCDPYFDKENLQFIYPNGYTEKLLLNYHL